MQKIAFTSPKNYELSQSRIDVWHIALDGEKYTNNALKLLNDDEKERYQRFYFDKHKRRFALARASMRLILSKYLAIDANKIAFNYTSHGKPFIADNGIEFNLSHSQETALLAVGYEKALGVDIEYFSERDLLGLAKHSFSQQEVDIISALPKTQLESAFFHVWAQKEAFIKALGLGLSYPTKDFSVAVMPPAMLTSCEVKHRNKWLLQSFVIDKKAWAALCYSPQATEIRHIRYRYDK